MVDQLCGDFHERIYKHTLNGTIHFMVYFVVGHYQRLLAAGFDQREHTTITVSDENRLVLTGQQKKSANWMLVCDLQFDLIICLFK